MLDVAEIESILAGSRRRGSRLLRAVLEGWQDYVPGTRLRSPLEAKLLPMLALRDIPAPRCNVKLPVGDETFEVDFIWRRERVIVEADGGKFHDNPQAEARDRRRDYVLSAAGYRVHRLRWYDLDERPEAAMHELAGLLRLGRNRHRS
jgi:very-short-patch-repair endonuclease